MSTLNESVANRGCDHDKSTSVSHVSALTRYGIFTNVYFLGRLLTLSRN